MFTLSAKIREQFGRKANALKAQGRIPGVVYGPGAKNVSIDVDEKEFRKVFKSAGESSLVEVTVEGEKGKRPVLIHEIQRDPVLDTIIHIDFYQADLTEEAEVAVPLVFEGVAPAEKDLGGTLAKNLLEIEVKALPQNLPQSITVNIESLKTFEDHILVKDLVLPANVQALQNPEEIVASVLPPQDIEAELAEEIKEEVEGVEKVEKEVKTEDVVEETPEEKPAA